MRFTRKSSGGGAHLHRIDKVNEIRRVLVAQMRQEIEELAQLVLVERIQDRIADQMVDEHVVDVPVPQVLEESAAVVKLFPQKRIREQNVDDSSHMFDEQDFLVLLIVEEIAGVVHCKPQVGLTPHDRVKSCSASMGASQGSVG